MIQKNIWMLCLSIGLTISLLSSCNEEGCDYPSRAEYVYVNETEHVITTPFGYTSSEGKKPYRIEPYDTLSIIIEDDGPRNATPESYVPPQIDHLTFYFGEDRYITYKSTSVGEGEGPTDMRNYKAEKIAENNFIFTYTFTQEDYNNATPLETNQ